MKSPNSSFFSVIYTHLTQIIRDKSTNKIFYFLCLNLSICVIEAFYGIMNNSLGLTSDALHMLFDSSAIIIGLIGSIIEKWHPDKKYTYGYGRIGVLIGFANGIALIITSIGIIIEAFERFLNPIKINQSNLVLVSFIGFIVNLFGIFSFEHHHTHHSSHNCSHKHHSHQIGSNLLFYGMFLHVLADTLGSLGVLVSSFLMQYYDCEWVDPLCSLFIAILISSSSVPLITNCWFILMQRTSPQMDPSISTLKESIMSIPEIKSISSFHIWQMNDENWVGTIHIKIKNKRRSIEEKDIFAIQDEIKTLYQEIVGLSHLTIQIDKES